MSGHAGYKKAGKDIVCAAISAVTLTALGGLQDVLKLKPSVKLDENSGYLKVVVPDDLNKESLRDANIILQTMYEGLKTLEFEYPKYIKLISE